MIGTHSINDAKMASRAAKPLRPLAAPTETFRLPATGLLPLTANDFLAPGQTVGLPIAPELAPLKAADFASAQPHLPSEKPLLMPLNDLDFVPGSRTPQTSENDRLATEAERWVAQTFFGTLLKQSRNSPFKSELFSGGRGGDAFGTVLDQELANRMAHGAGKQLVDSIVRSIQAARAYREQQPMQQPASEPKQDSLKTPKGYDFSKVRIHVAPALRG